MTADKLGPLTQAAIAAGRLPVELSAETYSKIADALVTVSDRAARSDEVRPGRR